MRSTICEGRVFLGRTLNETNCFSFLNLVVNLNTENVDSLGVLRIRFGTNPRHRSATRESLAVIMTDSISSHRLDFLILLYSG